MRPTLIGHLKKPGSHPGDRCSVRRPRRTAMGDTESRLRRFSAELPTVPAAAAPIGNRQVPPNSASRSYRIMPSTPDIAAASTGVALTIWPLQATCWYRQSASTVRADCALVVDCSNMTLRGPQPDASCRATTEIEHTRYSFREPIPFADSIGSEESADRGPSRGQNHDRIQPTMRYTHSAAGSSTASLFDSLRRRESVSTALGSRYATE
jgi:hypothetical protein